MKTLALITITTVILGLSSCSGDDNSSIAKNEKTLIVKTYGGNNNEEDNKIVFTGEDIKSFNEATREIIFNKEISFEGLTRNIVFYIDEEKLFKVELQAISPVSSYIINELALHAPGIDGKFYLHDGYPEIVYIENADGSTGTNISPTDIAAREENKQKRAKEWASFIEWLKDTGKLTD